MLMAAAIAVMGLLVLNSALAAPPPNRQPQLAPPNRPFNTAPLDLSAPSHLVEASEKTSAFRSLARRQTDSTEQPSLPNLGSQSMHAQPTMEDRVRAVRRDGFPVARLWESKSAVLHLGFNQKGKPGLWIMQKIH
jgi:hypothetical protein